MSKKFHILQLAGFGDTLSALTRIPAVKEKYPEHEIQFWLGGIGQSVEFSKQQIEREGYKASVVKNFSFHNQIRSTYDFIKENVFEENDILEDWSFCSEIFSNKDPVFYKYDLQFPYHYKTTKHPYNTEINFTPKNTVAIHPLTKSGNIEGFESDLEKGRFWSRDEWKNLCIKLCDNGYTPAFVGYGDEDWGLIEELITDGYSVLDKRMGVEDTIYFLQTVDAGIFCNSWDWEITSRAGIPTFCFYTKNHFFIQNHIPKGPSDFWNTCYIETNSDYEEVEYYDQKVYKEAVNASGVFDKIKYIIENKKSPNSNFSVCMIGMNNENHIQKTFNNIGSYISSNENNEFVFVDGGSTDKTIDITKTFIQSLNIKEGNAHIIENPWPNNHSVQKNIALEKTNNEWVVWIDTDETYEDIFWNQLGWYIRDADKNNFDSIIFPRINVITGVDEDKLEDFAKRQNWVLSKPFNWINYPDVQQRVYKNNCRYSNKIHIKINNANKEKVIDGVHCLHYKTYDTQVNQLIEYGEYKH